MCATRPKILRDPARIFLRPPGSAGILSSPQRYKDPTRSCPSESSWLRVFVVRFLGFRLRCSVFICVHLWFRFVQFMQTKMRRSEEHTSELQSRENLVCRLLLEKKNI